MNLEQFTLDEVEVEPFQVKEVLKCLIHTILFHRTLGIVKPIDAGSDLFDVTYVQCNDKSVEESVRARIEECYTQLDRSAGKDRSNLWQVVLSFFEMRSRRPSFFARSDQKVTWERWTFRLLVNRQSIDPAERTARQERLDATLRARIEAIVQLVNQRRDHVPRLVHNEMKTFPFEITVPSMDDSWSLDRFKNLMPPPTTNLL